MSNSEQSAAGTYGAPFQPSVTEGMYYGQRALDFKGPAFTSSANASQAEDWLSLLKAEATRKPTGNETFTSCDVTKVSDLLSQPAKWAPSDAPPFWSRQLADMQKGQESLEQSENPDLFCDGLSAVLTPMPRPDSNCISIGGVSVHSGLLLFQAALVATSAATAYGGWKSRRGQGYPTNTRPVTNTTSAIEEKTDTSASIDKNAQ